LRHRAHRSAFALLSEIFMKVGYFVWKTCLIL